MNNHQPKKTPNPTPLMHDLPGLDLNLSQIPSAPSTLQHQVCNVCCMFANLDDQINDIASSWRNGHIPHQLEDLPAQTMHANFEVIQFFERFDLDNIQAITHMGDTPDITDVIASTFLSIQTSLHCSNNLST